MSAAILLTEFLFVPSRTNPTLKIGFWGEGVSPSLTAERTGWRVQGHSLDMFHRSGGSNLSEEGEAI